MVHVTYSIPFLLFPATSFMKLAKDVYWDEKSNFIISKSLLKSIQLLRKFGETFSG